LAVFFFSSRRRHTRSKRDWSSDVCSSDLWKRATTSKHRYRCLWLAWTLAPSYGNSTTMIGRSQHHMNQRIKSLSMTRRCKNALRSEERRVGKECRARGSREHGKKKKQGRV